jgi:hypothetical protein
MTVIGSTTSSLLNYAGAGSAYARTTAVTDPLVTGVTTPASTDATNITLSDAARAALASQSATQTATKTFIAVTADTRAALDALYKAANVAGPLDKDGKPTIDLSSLDGRSLYAIASNSQGKFTFDEQGLAVQAMQDRFDNAIKPKLAASDLTGNYSDVYKAAMDYFDAMSPEEKANPGWAVQRTALAQGYQQTQQNPSVLPTNISNDLVADLAARQAQSPDTSKLTSFTDVATAVRATLDAQALDATRKGTSLVLDPSRKGGQKVDWSSLDNRSLSAIALNQGGQFSADEVRFGKKELDSRTRASMLQALQNSGSDPRALSYSILSQYSGMSDEERTASNWTTNFRDSAVANYKSASNLVSMLAQLNGGGSSDASSPLDFLSATS